MKENTSVEMPWKKSPDFHGFSVHSDCQVKKKCLENFYKTLYSSQILEDSFDASVSSFMNCNNLKRLNAEQQKTCEGLIIEEECLSTLKQFVKNKTPGSDGLTAEFHLCFWEYVATTLKDGLNETYQHGKMSITKKGCDFPAAKMYCKAVR